MSPLLVLRRSEGLHLGGIAKGAQEVPQDSADFCSILVRDRFQHLFFACQEVRHGPIGTLNPERGRSHVLDSAVSRILVTDGVTPFHHRVDAVGEGAGGDKKFVHELGWLRLIGLTLPTKQGQHLKLPHVEAVGCKRLPAELLKVSVQSQEPRKDLQRRCIEVLTFSSPRRDNLINLISFPDISFHLVSLLDIEISRQEVTRANQAYLALDCLPRTRFTGTTTPQLVRSRTSARHSSFTGAFRKILRTVVITMDA